MEENRELKKPKILIVHNYYQIPGGEDTVVSNEKKLNLFEIGKLTFEKPDLETFSCLATCIDAIKTGGLKPVAVNGANEAAVDLFLNEKISFLQIGELVRKAMDNQKEVASFNLEDVFNADKSAREFVYSQI